MTHKAALSVGSLVVLSATLVACSSGASAARSEALDNLLSATQALRNYALDVVADTTPVEALRELKRDQRAVLDGEAAATSVTWNAVFIGKGADGGGLSYEAIILRTCIRYTADLAGEPQVTWYSIPCPESIEGDRRFGPYDETVLLGSESGL